jgi:hypothetical protein
MWMGWKGGKKWEKRVSSEFRHLHLNASDELEEDKLEDVCDESNCSATRTWPWNLGWESQRSKQQGTFDFGINGSSIGRTFEIRGEKMWPNDATETEENFHGVSGKRATRLFFLHRKFIKLWRISVTGLSEFRINDPIAQVPYTITSFWMKGKKSRLEENSCKWLFSRCTVIRHMEATHDNCRNSSSRRKVDWRRWGVPGNVDRVISEINGRNCEIRHKNILRLIEARACVYDEHKFLYSAAAREKEKRRYLSMNLILLLNSFPRLRLSFSLCISLALLITSIHVLVFYSPEAFGITHTMPLRRNSVLPAEKYTRSQTRRSYKRREERSELFFPSPTCAIEEK